MTLRMIVHCKAPSQPGARQELSTPVTLTPMQILPVPRTSSNPSCPLYGFSSGPFPEVAALTSDRKLSSLPGYPARVLSQSPSCSQVTMHVREVCLCAPSLGLGVLSLLRTQKQMHGGTACLKVRVCSQVAIVASFHSLSAGRSPAPWW